jgi:hypothetical protein
VPRIAQPPGIEAARVEATLMAAEVTVEKLARAAHTMNSASGTPNHALLVRKEFLSAAPRDVNARAGLSP